MGSIVEQLLDDDNFENVIMYDENNKETEFSQVAIIPSGEEIYIMLKPVTKIAGVNEDEALVFQVVELDDEPCLVIVDDEAIVDHVFEEYHDLLRAEGIEVL